MVISKKNSRKIEDAVLAMLAISLTVLVLGVLNEVYQQKPVPAAPVMPRVLNVRHYSDLDNTLYVGTGDYPLGSTVLACDQVSCVEALVVSQHYGADGTQLVLSSKLVR